MHASPLTFQISVIITMGKDNLDVSLGNQFEAEDPIPGSSGVHDDEVIVMLEAQGPVLFEKVKMECFEDSDSENSDEVGQVLTDEEQIIPSEDDEWEPTEETEDDEEEEDGAKSDPDYKLKQDKRTVSKMKKTKKIQTPKSSKNSQAKPDARRENARLHICPICKRFFKNQSDLTTHHINRHTPKEQRPIKCPLCSYGTARKGDLERHMKLVHQIAKTKDGDYVDIPKIILPKRTAKLERKFMCEVCGHKAFFPVHLERHMLTHSDSRPFTCKYPDCKKSFRLEQHLKRHEDSHLIKEGKKLHPKSNNQTGDPIKCPFPNCYYKGTNVTGLKQHLLIHSSDQPFVCDYPGCEYRSKYQSALITHLVYHYPDKGFKCSTCGYVCGNKTRLRQHEEIHSQTLEFSCPNKDCDYKCSRQDTLRRHKRVHYTSANMQCPHCSKLFISEYRFRKHVDRHEHGKLASDAGASRSFECTFCGKTCRTSSNLKQHMRTHGKKRNEKTRGTKKRLASSKKKSTVPSKKKNQAANEPVIKAEVDHIKVENNPGESYDPETEHLGTHADVDMKMIQDSVNQACASVFSLIGNSSF